MFKPVAASVSLPEVDAAWLRHWQQHGIFEQALSARRDAPRFTFYEGPPTANGMPHPGHVLTRIMKDVFLRYKTMCGFYAPRIGGWDTHGLPVEVEVEKELGIAGRQAIEAYGVEAFTRRCIDSVFRYIDEWQRMTQRIGFWLDLEQAYVTFHKRYVESVWWALSELHRQGLLYQDYKIVWWWPQGGTALSAGEVGQGYRTVDDPSVVIRFPVLGVEKQALLAWTTTPWTLPSNVALAVAPEVTYALAQLEDGEQVWLAAPLLGSMLADKPHRIVEQRLGRELAGIAYQPPFAYQSPSGGRSHVVVSADFVTLDAGTGIVHVAPAFGEDDFRLAKQCGLGFLQLLQPDGLFPPEVSDFAGRFCKDADRDIIRHLRREGRLFAEATYRHEYPFCWRRDSDPLIQYARRSWFVRTTSVVDGLLANNAEVQWEPEHIRDGRFGQFLRGNVDWALSRERYWGTPLPIWVNDETGALDVVASSEEILQRNPQAFDAFAEARRRDPQLSEHLQVHKPWIDAVTWQKPGEPGTYRRVPEVIDCWFDSGCMPFAQWGYPHTGTSAFQQAFPADFITEAVDQTRGWFYSLLAVSTLLFKQQALPHPYRNCLVLGLITDDKGQKLSKSKRNYSDPLALMDKHGADAVRWALYAGTTPGQNTRFSEAQVLAAVREFLLKIWNCYSFFVTYATIDGWQPSDTAAATELDRWILAELAATVLEVRSALDRYRSHQAVRSLEQFVDALSNWYVRRSRNRFWAPSDASQPMLADKHGAFATLHQVLVELSKLIAPFCPFVAEAIYQNLVPEPQRLASVHLSDYPTALPAWQDEDLRREMALVRQVVRLGLRVRTEKKLKVRQPLAAAWIAVPPGEARRTLETHRALVCEELNVEELALIDDLQDYVHFQIVPDFRRLGPQLGARMPLCQEALKQADGAALYATLQRGEAITLLLSDGPLTLDPEAVQVRLQPQAGFAAAAEGDIVVLLKTEVDAGLLHKGWAREVVSRLQRARKDMALPFEARIRVAYRTADAAMAAAIEEHRTAIAEEVLATEIIAVDDVPWLDAAHHSAEIEQALVEFWLLRWQG